MTRADMPWMIITFPRKLNFPRRTQNYFLRCWLCSDSTRPCRRNRIMGSATQNFFAFLFLLFFLFGTKQIPVYPLFNFRRRRPFPYHNTQNSPSLPRKKAWKFTNLITSTSRDCPTRWRAWCRRVVLILTLIHTPITIIENCFRYQRKNFCRSNIF